MSAGVARAHGGDGGADPPPNQNRLPGVCEMPSNKKRPRGKSRNKNLEQAFADNGRLPLPIEFDVDGKTYHAIGKHGPKFTRLIGNTIGGRIPPYYKDWDKVPKEMKTCIIPALEGYFDLNRNRTDWEYVVKGIDDTCQKLYKDRKSKFKKHFMLVGGYENVNSAKQNPPKGMTIEEWGKTINFFTDPDNMERARKNSQNRSRSKYPSLHGSTSYAAIRCKQTNLEINETPGAISRWRDMHYRPTTGWINDEARLDYEKLVAERELQTQRAASMPDSLNMVNEEQIITKILGECNGHVRGQGRKLKGGTSLGFQTLQPTTQSTTPPNMVDRRFVEKLIDRHNDSVQHTHQVIQKLVENLMVAFPTLSIDPPSPPSIWVIDDLIEETIVDNVTEDDHPELHTQQSENGDDQMNLDDDIGF